MRFNFLLSPRRLLATLLTVIMLSQWGSAAWIYAKANVAQWMIASAWEASLNLEQPIKPWRWADTWPVARLQWQPKGHARPAKDLYVLNGVHGEALAFGPGLMDYADNVNQQATVLAGHRDTHFRFLQDVKPNDKLRMQTADGVWHEYTVEDGEVRHIDNDPLTLEHTNHLLLITCYPFDAINPGGPLRYLVNARPVNTALLSTQIAQTEEAAIKSAKLVF